MPTQGKPPSPVPGRVFGSDRQTPCPKNNGAVGGSEWRAFLHQLQGLPLLPCIGKRPALSNWQHAAYSPQLIEALGPEITGVGTRTGPDAGGLMAVDLDGAAALVFATERGCDPAEAETWQITRDTDPHRLKVLWAVPQELWHVLGKLHTMHQLRPPVKDPDGKILRKGEGIEVYFGSGQILLLGLHPESGSQYGWRWSPQDLAEIPPEWWALVLELTDGAPRFQEGQSSRSATGSTDWHRLPRCPICGRNERPVCQRHRDGQTIRCFHGGTFRPPAGLTVGGLIPGTPWAFCREQSVGWAVFSIFRRHTPRAVQLPSGWKQGGRARG